MPRSFRCSSRDADRRARPLIHGDGEQSRDFTFVADVVQANLLAAEAPGVSGRVYNIAVRPAHQRCSELVAKINDLLGTDIDPGHEAAAARRREAQPGRRLPGRRRPRLLSPG